MNVKMRLTLGMVLSAGFMAAVMCSLAHCADAPRIPDINNPASISVAIPGSNPAAPAAPVVNVSTPPATVTIAPAAPAVTDWTGVGTDLGFLILKIAALYAFIKLHHSELGSAANWVNLIASCYRQAGGNVSAALALIPGGHQEVYGSPPTATDMAEAKHALGALHLEAAGNDPIDSSKEDIEMQEATKKLNEMRLKKGLAPIAMILLCLFALALTGCTAGKRPQSLVDAENKEHARYEADHANQNATNSAYDAALLQSQTNYFTELHNERIRDIQNGVAADPTKAADGIAAAAAANTTLMNQIAAQQAAQAAIRNIVTQSTATNIVQARQLHDAIQNYDNTAPFSAAAAATSVANTVQSLIPAPTPISTAPTPAVKPATSAPAPKPVTPAPAGTILN